MAGGGVVKTGDQSPASMPHSGTTTGERKLVNTNSFSWRNCSSRWTYIPRPGSGGCERFLVGELGVVELGVQATGGQEFLVLPVQSSWAALRPDPAC